MDNIFDLKNKVAIVTGASSGLGVQFSKVLARNGANVAIMARRMEKLLEVKSELEAYGIECLAIQCDVTNTDNIKKSVEKVYNHFGKIDILVNNAGIAIPGIATDQNDDQWKKMIDTNLNSVYYFCREVGKYMVEAKYGKIINVGSIHSQVAMSGFPLSAYCTSKGGVKMLTQALATEWAKENITVNAIGPAYFPSEMTSDILEDQAFLQQIQLFCPMGRAGKTGELDGAIIYFASDASSYTSGQLLSIDGGWTAV